MSVSLLHWIDATLESAKEVATVTLEVDQVEELGRQDELKGVHCGAFVAVVGPSESVEIGFASSRETCVEFTRALFCMEPESDPVEDDIADAVGEITNMLAGGVKTAMAGLVPGCRLGLPVFFNGHIGVSRRHEAKVIEVMLGKHPALLLIVRNPA